MPERKGEPTTEAGRRLLADVERHAADNPALLLLLRTGIVLIEQEARASRKGTK